MIKTFVRNVLLLLAVLCLLLLGLEGLFRIARREDALKLSMGRADSKYHHSLTPNSELHLISSVPGEYDITAHINNSGFRGPDIEIDKKPGQKRIFIVGDSFAFGVGSEDHQTISAFMQGILDPTAEKIEVVNVGRGHDSPLTYYLRLRDEVPKFRPDVVIMLLDFSDLWEDWNGEKNLLYDPSGNIIGSNPYYEYGSFKLWNFLRSKSVLCMYLHNKVVRTFRKIQRLGLSEYIRSGLGGKRAKAVIAYQEGDTIEFDGRLFMRGKPKAKEIEEHFKRTGKYILMSSKIVAEHKAKLILVMYPYGVYIGPDQWGEGRVFWGFEKGKVYTDYFAFELVQKFARENNIPFINLLDDFLKNKAKQLFFPYDGHFTFATNQVVAEALAKHPAVKEAVGIST